MGLLITAVADVVVVGLAVFVVFSQPRPVWSDAAEHSRWFWLTWATAAVVIGFAPAVAGALDDWAAAVWLTVWCAFAAVQPAMWVDVLEVRRDIARRRRSTLDKRARGEARVQAAAIRWHED